MLELLQLMYSYCMTELSFLFPLFIFYFYFGEGLHKDLDFWLNH